MRLKNRLVVIALASVLLALGACTSPTAPAACEPGTAVLPMFTIVQDSLGMHETVTYDTVPTLCEGGP